MTTITVADLNSKINAILENCTNEKFSTDWSKAKKADLEVLLAFLEGFEVLKKRLADRGDKESKEISGVISTYINEKVKESGDIVKGAKLLLRGMVKDKLEKILKL